MVAMGAQVRLVSTVGDRMVTAKGLYNDDGIAYLHKRPEELLTEIHLPPVNGSRAVYKKLRRRGAFDFPVLSVGAAVWREGGTVTAARLVLGGVASAPVRLSAAESVLVGRALDGESIATAAEAAAGPSRPMDNTDFSFLWRKEMTKQFVARALRDLEGLPRGAEA
jgi:4-hydroxybenzoyl-CoA reductase subunit beta